MNRFGAVALCTLLLGSTVAGCAAPSATIKQDGPGTRSSSDQSAVKASIDTQVVVDGKVNPVLKGFMQEVQGSINSRITGMGQWALLFVVVGMRLCDVCETWITARNQCRA